MKPPKRPQDAPKPGPSEHPAPVVPAQPAPQSDAPSAPVNPKAVIDPHPPRPVSEVVPDLTAAVERMREASERFRRTVESFIAKTGATAGVKCPHGGPDHMLDFEETCRASWQKPDVELVYAPCADCRARELTPDDLRLHRLGAPKTLLKATFDNWKPRLASDHAVLNTCRDFAARPSGFLVLQGGVGLGKTHLSVAIMRTVKGGRLVTQNAFLLMLRETYRNDRATNPVEICKTTRLLVFDELGVSSGGKDEFPALYEVLNHRYNEDLPTVLTTNVAVAEFVQAFGDRIADRLATAKFCALKGESWRKPK